MTFTACGQETTVLARPSSLTDGLEAGLHYTFNLSIGKDAVTLSSVCVTDWADGGTYQKGYPDIYVEGDTANATINGGTVESFCFDSNPAVVITGGTFGENPTEHLAAGYTATYNETDSTWTVAPSNN